jgi:hypothetical protein
MLWRKERMKRMNSVNGNERVERRKLCLISLCFDFVMCLRRKERCLIAGSDKVDKELRNVDCNEGVNEKEVCKVVDMKVGREVRK